MTELVDNDGAIVLPGRLDIEAAEGLRLRFLNASGDVSVDARDVSILSTAAVQVLLAGRDHIAEAGHAFTIERPSRHFLDDLRILGIPIDRLQAEGDAT